MLIVIVPAASAWAQGPTTSLAVQPDLAALFRQFAAAINQGDVAGALSLFTDDASWERGGRCPPGACVGKEAIRNELDKDLIDHHQIDLIDIQVSGDSAIVRFELQTDGTRAAGLGRIVQLFIARVRGDKITSVRVVPDITDPETAGFLARQRGPEASPITGGGQVVNDGGLPFTSTIALISTSGLLLTAAVWGWRRSLLRP